VDLVKSSPLDISCIESFIAVRGEEGSEIWFDDIEPLVLGLGEKEETWIEQIRECGYPEAVYTTDLISAG
jgi:hypothetical protein